MHGTVYLNDIDAADLGFNLSGLPGWADGLAYEFELLRVPGRLGQVARPLVTAQPRVLEIRGFVDGATWADRADLIDSIVAHCAGEAQIRFGDRPDRYVSGYLQTPTGAPLAPAGERIDGGWTHLSLRFLCPDPAFYAVDESVVSGIGATPVEIPAGSLAMGGQLVISGGTNPVVRAYRADDTQIGQMTFAANLSGATLTIDLSNRELSTTLAANPWSLWSGWQTERFIDWSNTDWDYRAGAWAKLSVSSGTATYTYRKTYQR